MHAAVHEWVERFLPSGPVSVLDVGGRDVNGTVRPLFHSGCRWCAVDLVEHPSVDWVGDFLDFCPDECFDVVLYLEVAEHVPVWGEHLRHARDCCANGGALIVTAAAPDRGPHSAVDGGPLRPGEFYAGVDPGVLSASLRQLFRWSLVDVTDDGQDVRAIARRI